MKIILLDYGHGGMIDSIYQTAPKKMYAFPNGKVAYEGVLNRQVGHKAHRAMEKEGIKVIPITPTNLDVGLQTRVQIINNYCAEFGTSNCLLISLHANAGKGHGFEIWTSPGHTSSDLYADKYMKMYSEVFPNAKLRKDLVDGDVDKESFFYILMESKCAAILPEWDFFDNYHSFMFMSEEINQLIYASMICNFAKSIQ